MCLCIVLVVALFVPFVSPFSICWYFFIYFMFSYFAIYLFRYFVVVIYLFMSFREVVYVSSVCRYLLL